MSKQELVDAYRAGGIDRRAFVRGLTGLGVSASVAASYAVALQPAAAKHDDLYDFYGHPKSKADCKNGGYLQFGFKTQGRCIRYVNRRKRKGDGNR